MVGTLRSDGHSNEQDEGEYQIDDDVRRALLQPARTSSGGLLGIRRSADEFDIDTDADESSDEVVEYKEDIPDESDAHKYDCGQCARMSCDNEKNQAGNEQTDDDETEE